MRLAQVCPPLTVRPRAVAVRARTCALSNCPGLSRPRLARRRSSAGGFPTVPIAVLAICLLICGPVAAQDTSGLSQALGQGSLTSQTLVVLSLVTVLSLAPGIAVMITCFPFIVTVLSILRQAIGLAQAPPNMLIVALSLFLTWYIMEPVFLDAWARGVVPLLDGRLDPMAAATEAMVPFRTFMAGRADPATVAQLAALRPDVALQGAAPAADTLPLSVLVPSFMLSEVARAFQIGFVIFLPFLIIDLVVSAVLMSMGMMMVPPAIVALPFKLAFFVLADGWTLLSTALVRSYM